MRCLDSSNFLPWLRDSFKSYGKTYQGYTGEYAWNDKPSSFMQDLGLPIVALKSIILGRNERRFIVWEELDIVGLSSSVYGHGGQLRMV